MAQEELQTAIAALGLTIKSEFVPFSRSRNAKPHPKISDRSLNWKVTLLRNGREVLTTDYGAGIAHCPSYKQGTMNTYDAERIVFETEHGYKAGQFSGHVGRAPGSKPLEPNTLDVIYSLTSDSDVLDCGTFEEWASNLGYNTDSRKAEAIYRACLEIALKLRNALGDEGLAQLRNAAQDY